MFGRSLRSFTLLGATACAVLVACSDSTGPVATRIPGTYELTTVLDTYTYPANCVPTGNGPSCSQTTVVAGPSKLYGTFTLGSALPADGSTFTFPVSSADLRVADCALSATQCDERPFTWYSGSFSVKRDSLTLFGEMTGVVHIYLNGRFVDDRFTGTIGWYTYIGCCGSSYYSGTFVAARQR
jgi:hypothetical protein